jgi:hypothetical protein
MGGTTTRPNSRSEVAHSAYQELGARFAEHDPRDQYTYMYSKLRSDYTLMEFVGMDGQSVLNVGCSFPVDELYYARKIGHWTAIDRVHRACPVRAEGRSWRSLEQVRPVRSAELRGDDPLGRGGGDGHAALRDGQLGRSVFLDHLPGAGGHRLGVVADAATGAAASALIGRRRLRRLREDAG